MSDYPKLLGSVKTGLVKGPTTTTSTPGKGGQTVEIYRGQLTDIVSKANELYALGWQTQVVEDAKGGIFTLTATFSIDVNQSGGVENPVPVWEIQGHPIQQSLFESDRPFVKALTAETKAIVERCIKTASNAPIGSLTNETQLENAYVLLAHLRNGVESRQLFVPTVKRTITVSSTYVPTWALANVDKLWTKAGLVAAYNVPNNVSPLLPDTDAAGVLDTNTGLTFFYGYLEQYPTITTVNGNRTQISQEWIWNRWTTTNNGLYDLA